MSEDMQKQIDEFRMEMRAGFQAIGGRISVLENSQTGLAGRVFSVEGRLTSVEGRLTRLEKISRETAITVAKHTEAFVRVEARLDRLDGLFPAIAKLQSTMDALAGEILNSRSARVLTDKSIRDQKETLQNHEARLLRLERRRKPS